jgi:malic enzyme
MMVNKQGFSQQHSPAIKQCEQSTDIHMTIRKIVIVGAGQAATQAATSLRAGGYSGKITMIGQEATLPYQRPPLSKAYLSGAMSM